MNSRQRGAGQTRQWPAVYCSELAMHPFRRLFPLRWLSHAADLLLPGSCALCGNGVAGLLCDACRLRYLSDVRMRCRRCASTLTDLQPLCGRCLARPPAFDASRAAVAYAPPVDQLVQRLKFRAQLPLAQAFAQLMLRQLDELPADRPAAVIPVPLSEQRLCERGFNQALEIARPLARALRVPVHADACVRVRDTVPQATLALADRQGNMRGAFAMRDRDAVRSHHLLVVDDVMTTGHTLDALAACLKRHGAASVTNCVFARTPLR